MMRGNDLYDFDGCGGNRWPEREDRPHNGRIVAGLLGLSITVIGLGIWTVMPTLCRWAAVAREALLG